MAEASRIAFMAAERQKGDFVGSISHELRSPLHGILASVEFLADTEFDPFQNNLVDTISSCGRTLLDTVNHILDYSKMNAYEKNWLTAKKSRAQKSTVAIKSRAAVVNQFDKDAPPLMNLYATTDVAAIAEEVVEGIYAGQIYQDSEWILLVASILVHSTYFETYNRARTMCLRNTPQTSVSRLPSIRTIHGRKQSN